MGKKDKSDRGKMDAMLSKKKNYLIQHLWTMQYLLLSNVNVNLPCLTNAAANITEA